MIRVSLPFHLRNLANVQGEVRLAVNGPVTLKSVLDALERCYPMLKGTCGLDLSNQPPDADLPDEVAGGSEPLMVVGAMAGG